MHFHYVRMCLPYIKKTHFGFAYIIKICFYYVRRTHSLIHRKYIFLEYHIQPECIFVKYLGNINNKNMYFEFINDENLFLR